MQAPESSFPLSWPVGWARTTERKRAHFGTVGDGGYGLKRMTAAVATKRLLAELHRLGADAIMMSTNMRTRQDGFPVATAAEPTDPGVAVYFRLKGEPRVLACDRWDKVADNVAALAKHIDSIRGQVRWGVGSLEQAFRGYKALPEMGASKPWYEVLAVSMDAPWPIIEKRRTKLLRDHHPDLGGAHDSAAEINAAFDEARRFVADRDCKGSS